MISDKFIVGTWTYKARKAPFGFRKGKVLFSQEKGSIKATIKIYGLKIKTKDLKITGDELSFVASVDPEQILIELKRTGGKLTGQAHFSEGSLDLTMDKKGSIPEESDEVDEPISEIKENPRLSERRKSTKEKAKEITGKSKIHTFYYIWYGNVETDGEYRGWNHPIIPHKVDTTWNDTPPHSGGDDVGSNFYPQLGSYSSNDPRTIETHMEQMHDAGIGVVSLSWWGKGGFTDQSIMAIMDAAQKYGLKVCFHIEPRYDSVEDFRMNMEYISENYNDHQALFRLNGLPLYYLYNSFKLETEEWYEMLNPDSATTIRNTKMDGLFINLLTSQFDGDFTVRSGFDGFYTYYASDGFAYGCTTSNWPHLAGFARENNLIYIPCAGPGYRDTRVRPWNDKNTKKRDKGDYYEAMMRKAAESGPDFIGITSFNEWFEGTQIEPAVPKSIEGYTYEDYGNDAEPLFYIKKTKELIDKYIKK